MGERGPSPTPTLKLVQRGSWRGKVRKNEPEPAPGVPNPPSWLTKEAGAEWRRVVPALAAEGLLSKVDRAALSMMCQSWADYVAARQELKAEGVVFKTEKGYIAKNPRATIMNEAFERWRKIALQFGLTPGARAGLATTKSDPDENRGKRNKFRSKGA